MVASLLASVLLTSEDFSRSVISSAPVGGESMGSKFVCRQVNLLVLGFDTVSERGKVVDRARKLHLEFGSQDTLFPPQQITIMFTLDPSQSLSGAKVILPNLKFGTDEYRAFYYGSGSRVARGVVGIHLSEENRSTEMIHDGASGRIEFGKESKGFIPGQIVMMFPDGKGWLNGQFKAKVSRR